MRQSATSVTVSCWNDQEIVRLLCSQIFIACSKIPPLEPILSHVNEVHIFNFCFLISILLLSSHLILVSRVVSSFQVFRCNSPISSHYLISLMIFTERQQILKILFIRFLHPHLGPSPLDPNILLCNLFLRDPQSVFSDVTSQFLTFQFFFYIGNRKTETELHGRRMQEIFRVWGQCNLQGIINYPSASDCCNSLWLGTHDVWDTCTAIRKLRLSKISTRQFLINIDSAMTLNVLHGESSQFLCHFHLKGNI